MFYNILRMEYMKNLRRPFFWIEIAVLVGLLTLFVALFFLLQSLSEATRAAAGTITWPQGPAFAEGLLFSIGRVLLIILVSVMVAREFTWRTIQLWLSQGLSRPVLMLAKWLILVVDALIMTAVAVVTSSLLTLICSFIINGTVHTQGLDVVQVLLSYVRTFYTLLPYISLTFLLAVLTRSTAAAISIGLVFALVIEGLVAQLGALFNEQVARFIAYLPNNLAASVNTLNNPAQDPSTSPLAATQASPTVAAIMIAVYTLVFLGLAIFAFQRQDLTQ
ncbi:hypothetical protein KDA_41070 [Dictyobacter alpinus]|uniref:ABC transporter permease n=1 Tax=Dictyobacter alpinus TaxID=2014873 RepID=A0A402BB43_9CHLR|nr:ABC transporter permease subunit [Dictyobacter alpinus]GCE28623.1 hypothetical protein KDA_41070 [Dictyobacter alpinus]